MNDIYDLGSSLSAEQKRALLAKLLQKQPAQPIVVSCVLCPRAIVVSGSTEFRTLRSIMYRCAPD